MRAVQWNANRHRVSIVMHQSGPVRADFRTLSPPSPRFSEAFFGQVRWTRSRPLRIQLTDIARSTQGPFGPFSRIAPHGRTASGSSAPASIPRTEKDAIRLQHTTTAHVHKTGRDTRQNEAQRLHQIERFLNEHVALV